MSLASPCIQLVSQVICLASLVGDGCDWVYILGWRDLFSQGSLQICRCVWSQKQARLSAILKNAVTLGGLMACLRHTNVGILPAVFSTFKLSWW